MPELPEVETIVPGLHERVVDTRIEKVTYGEGEKMPRPDSGTPVENVTGKNNTIYYQRCRR